MAALVCDICGGKLVIGAGGVAVCESCGMEHSADRMKEKVQEIKGAVRVDNSHMIENYLEMARTAKEGGNYAEAETYCNKVIEIDPANYKAWTLKGEAVAWQSSLQNSRVDEGVNAIVKGINNAPEEEKEELIEEAKEQIKNLAVAMISLRADRFAKWPDQEETAGFLTDMISILNTVLSFLGGTGAEIPLEELMAPVATKINQAVVSAWQNVVWPEYNGNPNDSDDRPGNYELQTFLERVGYCTALVEKAIDLCENDLEDDIQRYENLIFIHKAAIDSCSWDYSFTSYGTKIWHKKLTLTEAAKDERRKLIDQYENKIREIKAAVEEKKAAERAAEKARREEEAQKAREEAQKRLDAYWAEHAKEKAALETEKEELDAQISALYESLHNQTAALRNEIANIPGRAEINNIEERITQLRIKKEHLGLFSGKEKKALQEQIDQAYTEKKHIEDRMAAAQKEIEARIEAVTDDFQEKISPLQNRVDAINNELTKDR